MEFISDDYKKLNETLHHDRSDFGKRGARWASAVFELAEHLKTKDILDYGCGKSSLSHHLPFKIQQYDPCIEKFAALPNPADIVVCTDVLEHVEPEKLESILAHLASLIKKMGLLVISTIPAQKVLENGQNAHLIIQPSVWWVKKILNHFEIVEYKNDATMCMFFVKK